MILNCITIDDEPLALTLINTFIQRTAKLQLVQSFSSSSVLLEALPNLDFHVLFLDIQMPGSNGIEIAKKVNALRRPLTPKIVFITAYNQYAVESYRVDALDYLLKPFEYEDFLFTTAKIERHFASKITQQIPTPVQEEALFVRAGYQLVKIPWQDIKYIEGLKDYVKIFLKSTDKNIITLATLKSLEHKLPGDRFRRVQKSYIVALDAISSLATNSLWVDDMEISIGEQYKVSLHTVFSNL